MSDRRRRLGIAIASLGVVLALGRFLPLLNAGTASWAIWGLSVAVALAAVALAARTRSET